MKYPLNRRILGFVAGLGLVFNVSAQNSADVNSGSNIQDLSLFDAVEVSTANSNGPDRPSREARATISEPEFTLIGVSNIGGTHSAMLRHRDGEVLRMKADAQRNTPIPRYNGYSIVEISASSVAIQYPENNACIEFNDQGVRCFGAGNIAELVLANGEPLKGVEMNTDRDLQNTNSVDLSEDVTADPANPFEALRNAQNSRVEGDQDGNPAGGRFIPRRINPEDVPEGMRIIATPFGDRLVPQ